MGNLFGKREKGLVSIVVPTYNREKYIGEALDCLKNQTYKNIEVVVIDDCSTDNSAAVINNWREKNKEAFKNFIYLKLPKNRDEEWACNIGFYLTAGEFIGLQHSDDISPNERIEREIEFFKKHPETALVGAKYKSFIGTTDNIVGEALWLSYDREEIEKTYKKNMGHCVSMGALLFRPSLLEDIIGFKKAFYGVDDWYFIYEIITHDYIVDNINETLSYYRKHDEQKCNLMLNHEEYKAEKMKQIEGRISVILPIYIEKNNALNALKGILDQSYNNIEIIIVDDLLDSNLESQIKACYDEYAKNNPEGAVKDFIYFKLPRKVGYPWIYNIGAYLSLGEYIVFHGDNGVSHKDKLKKQVEFFKRNPSYSAVGTNYDKNDGWIKYDDDIRYSYEINYTHCVHLDTLMVRTDVINKTGGLSENIVAKEDFEFINRLVSKGFNIQNLKEILYYEENK